MELDLPLLKKGSLGAMVAQAQTLLNLKGGCKLDVDGNYAVAPRPR